MSSATPHIGRRSKLAIAAAVVASGALLAAGVAGGADAAPAGESSGAAAALLSGSQRVEMLKAAEAEAGATAKSLALGAKEKLVVRDVVKDKDGTVHTRYERTYDGMPVLGGDLIVHKAKSGETKGVTKATKAKITVASTKAEVSPAAAEKSAVSIAKSAEGAKAKGGAEPRKVIWAADGKPVLAWETVTGGFQKDGTPSKLHVITDANTGKKLHEFQAIHTGDGESQYSGKVKLTTSKEGSGFTLKDGDRGGHTTSDLENKEDGEGKLFTDEDDKWGNGKPDERQTAAVDAHYGAQLTWDYYKKVHKRDGIKGDGKGATTRVHYGENYVNAFWDDSCFCMTYGDGEGNKHPLTSIDVAAHEMTHGVTSATAGLEYSGESGGLNEATSDIFAAAVEFNAENKEDVGDYLVGEKIDINGDGTPLRYMDKPSKDGGSKDNWEDGIGNEDVHYSSGVGNHFFYLLSEGSGKKEINGVKYDSPTADGKEVKGIGRDKAEQIWFKALTTYMTTNTDYKGAREATVKAANDLYGEGSAETKGVEAAWTGVNVK
ncbi:M4 family metallopeptidase [Streptomyces sp. NPDC051776]|uniref:M4 family metallopeptidase n=1 Tax=Streptomyces sp. NPDC051776 TaxID=3155414 RepID=UPI003446DBA0